MGSLWTPKFTFAKSENHGHMFSFQFHVPGVMLGFQILALTNSLVLECLMGTLFRL